MERSASFTTGVTRRRFLAGLAAAGAAVPLARPRVFASPPRPEADQRLACIFTKHLQWLDYDAMAEVAAEIGFDGVDLTVRPGGHVLPERVGDDLPRAVEAVRRAGLQAPMMTTAITDPADPRTEPILQTGGALGIRYYRLGYLDYPDGRSLPDALAAYRAQLGELAAMNAQYGLHGGYQNHDGTRVGSPVWDLWLLLQDRDPRWIGCQYDVRHATVEGGNAWPLGLRLLHPYVKTTVVKDFKWEQRDDGRWRAGHVPIGEGMVDWPAYLGLVKTLGLDGPMSFHFEYPMPEEDKTLSEAERTKQTVAVMRRDLQRMRTLMQEAGL